ncbi:MAG TPA: protein kinase [Bryobacteraceae bacterium]
MLRSLEPDQPELVHQVRSLLEAHDRGPGWLDRNAIDHLADDDEPAVQAPSASGATAWLRPRPRAFWVFLAIDLVGIAFYIFCGIMVAHYKSQTVDWGYDTDLTHGVWRIVSPDPRGRAVGKLNNGDEILAINDDVRTPAGSVLVAFQTIHAGPYRMRVATNGVPREIQLALGVKSDPKQMGDVVAFGIVSLAFFFTAVVLGLLKSEQTIAQRGYLALMMEGLVLAKVLVSPYLPFLAGASFAIYEILSLLDGVHFAFAYLFYSTLFERVLPARAWKRAVFVLFAWGAVITSMRAAVECGHVSGFLNRHPRILEFDLRMDPYFYVLAPLAICAVIARNYVRVRQPDERRRAKWIAYGSLAGILPYLVFRLLMLTLESWSHQWSMAVVALQAVRRLSILAAILIPAATGYAIYKHRMFDISVAVRRGIRYVLAKSVLQLTLALPAIALIVALTRDARRTVKEAILTNSGFIVLLILAAAVFKFRIPLQRWLDRRFFRESFRREQLLLSLVDSAQKLHSLSEMAETVANNIEAAFHPECIAILYHSPKDRFYVTAYSTGCLQSDLRIRENSPLLALLEADSEARHLASMDGVATSETRRFIALGIDIVIPMIGAARGISGLILLGNRLAEEPYSSEDQRLLTALAGQMAIFHENVSLHRDLAEQRKTAEKIRVRLETRGIDGFRECPLCGVCYDLSVLRCPKDGAEPAFALPIRRTVDRYRLDRLIGKGGMGTVYEAEDLSLRRRVAVKIMTGPRTENPVSLRRIYREARAASRLNHPNVITTYDFGVIDDVAYLVMELVAGQTLRQAMNDGPLDGPIAAIWFDQLLLGAEAAHCAGIVHRDLKPENVLISTSSDGKPLVKILDFGVAKADLQFGESSTLTSPGAVLGSIHYMSPEQLGGGKVDARSDLFSIGVMVFEFLTGRLPFAGETYTERVISVLRDEVAFPTGSGSDRLGAALKKCLAKDPADRFSSAAELRSVFVPLLSPLGRLWGSGALGASEGVMPERTGRGPI